MSLLHWKYALENVNMDPLAPKALSRVVAPKFLEFSPLEPVPGIQSAQIIYFSTNRRGKKKQENRSGKKLAEQLRILEPRLPVIPVPGTGTKRCFSLGETAPEIPGWRRIRFRSLVAPCHEARGTTDHAHLINVISIPVPVSFLPPRLHPHHQALPVRGFHGQSHTCLLTTHSSPADDSGTSLNSCPRRAASGARMRGQGAR
jgi:hypothetical protein